MLPVVAQADPFTPFVPVVQQRFAEALAAALGLPKERPVSLAQAHATRDGAVRACIRVDGGPAPVFVELSTATPSAQGFFRGKRWVLGYWSAPGGADPLSTPDGAAILGGVKETLARLDSLPDDDPAVQALDAAVREFRGFSTLRDRHFRYAAPREAMIRLGFRCNQKCDFCWQGRDWPEPPVELYERWVDELAATGVKVLHFSGGEPTIHPALPALVARASRLGLQVWLQTNAIRFSKPAFADAMVKAGVKGLFVSYHSHLAEISDDMTQAPGTHGPTERGIVAALERRLPVVLNVVVDTRNAATLPGHAAHVVERFVKGVPGARVSLSYSHPGPALDASTSDRHLAPFDVVAAPLTEALELLRSAHVDASTGGTCGFPPCTFADAPKFAQFDPPGTYARADAPDRRYGPACERCVVRDRCIGLRAPYVAVHGFRGTRPFLSIPATTNLPVAAPADWDRAEPLPPT